MKKIGLFIVLLVLSIIHVVAQDTSIKGTITLSHQGKTTDFAYNKMADVVETAIDGDTVFLSTGYFNGDFILDKKLAFIGSGADTDKGNGNYTFYEGRIILRMQEDTKLSARLFEGIYFWNSSFTYETSIENVIFKKCRGCGYNITLNADIKSILFDRCHIEGYGYYNSIHTLKAIARNCRIEDFAIWNNRAETNSWQFINCTINLDNWGYTDEEGIYHVWSPIYGGTFMNCIIDNIGNDNTGCWLYNPQNIETTSSASFMNCLLNKPTEEIDIFNGATTKDNMFFDHTNIDNSWENLICNFTKEKLQENNFLGNDGTVVGCYGGKNPYTLKQMTSTITSSKVHFDKENKQIQIKMKVSSEQ